MRKTKLSALIVAVTLLGGTSWQAQATDSGHHGALFQRLCAKENNEARHHKIGERLAAKLKLTSAQQAAYDDFQQTRVKSIDDTKSKLCTKEPDLSSYEDRLNFRQSFLEARLDAMKAENPKLIAFYNSLDDKQKRKFDDFRKSMRK
ncbi:Spy/CpxP family protein refolding chaperone [Bradyrhizobium sp.]|uniref:Spy/CpxP family protein refolding chaperone n=1 Tax=Bradyrhizobium sp. TaxID=376 RepID=UPI002625C205|nr:Spy/CpxP family protein refolding chaperone [Bradyrhizobium sp.]